MKEQERTNFRCHFQPTGPFRHYMPQLAYTATYTPPEKNLIDRITYYFLRALLVIQSALRLLKSSSPYIEQYSPILKQLPNMYKMIKLIQDVKEDTEEVAKNSTRETKNKARSQIPQPTLFI